MNDNRFEFEKIERPLTWLNFYKGAGGTFRSGGKIKLAPDHALAKKFPDKVASKEEMAARAAKMGGAGGDADFDGLITRNTDALKTSMSDSDIQKLRKVNKDSTPEELSEALNALAGVDTRTFDPYINASRDTTGKLPPMWNEHFRRLEKITGMDDEDQVRRSVATYISTAKADARNLGADKNITAAVGKDITAGGLIKQDPQKYLERQRKLYENDFGTIANRMADIRIAQIQRQKAAQEREFAKERARQRKAPKSKEPEEITEDDLLSFF